MNNSRAFVAEQQLSDAQRAAIAEFIGEERVACLVNMVEAGRRRPKTPREYTMDELYITLAMDYCDLHGEERDAADLFGPGGWLLECEPQLRLSENVLVPDIAGWPRDRMSAWPDTDAFTLAPDWVCEILHGRSPHVAYQERRAVYARAAIPHLWVVDPASPTIEARRLRASAHGAQRPATVDGARTLPPGCATSLAIHPRRLSSFTVFTFCLRRMSWVRGPRPRPYAARR